MDHIRYLMADARSCNITRLLASTNGNSAFKKRNMPERRITCEGAYGTGRALLFEAFRKAFKRIGFTYLEARSK